MKRSAAAISAQPGAITFSSIARSRTNCLSSRTVDACGVRMRVAASLKAVTCSSVTGADWYSANMARRASRWSTASIAYAPDGRVSDVTLGTPPVAVATDFSFAFGSAGKSPEDFVVGRNRGTAVQASAGQCGHDIRVLQARGQWMTTLPGGE